MKKSTIVKVVVYTWASSLEVTVYYVNGRQRVIKFNEISELPKTVQNVIIGNENTVVCDNKTIFYADNASDKCINSDIATNSEWARNITVKGEKLNEWNVLMVYLMIFTSSHFRITRNTDGDTRAYVNPFGSTIGCNYEPMSKRSILTSAVTKYETNDILKERVERI